MRGFKHALENDMKLERRISEMIRQELKYLPEGRLMSGGRGPSIYYRKKGENAKSIPPDDPLAAEIARRVFLEKQLAMIEANLKGQEKLSAVYHSYGRQDILQEISKVYRRVDELAVYHKERKESFHDENLKHFTPDSQLRRSKSEVILSMLFDNYRIPYSYEERVYWPETASAKAWEVKRQLGLKDFYVPDFTFTFPDGRKKYLEHLGMMSEAGYMEDWKKKMIFYYWTGITPGHNLIITADDCHGRLNQQEIASIIEGQLGELIGIAVPRTASRGTVSQGTATPRTSSRGTSNKMFSNSGRP